MLTIHGRTRAQLYKGTADWTLIGEVRRNPRMRIPIIGNGDITTPEEAKEAFDRYGVDGIMIGRASFGHPWIFREVKHYLATGELLPPMSVRERVDLAKKHLAKSLELKDERRGIFEMRRHFCYQGMQPREYPSVYLRPCRQCHLLLKTIKSIHIGIHCQK